MKSENTFRFGWKVTNTRRDIMTNDRLSCILRNKKAFLVIFTHNSNEILKNEDVSVETEIISMYICTEMKAELCFLNVKCKAFIILFFLYYFG